jgi:putative ABC transport system permease protein
LGARDRDRRKGGHTVDGLAPPNLATIEAPDLSHLPPHLRIYNPHIDPSVTWDTLDWLDPDMPVLEVGTLGDAVRANLAILEMAADFLFIFGVAGMALAGMGIYGLVSYTVRQSTHEIGIRMALGARGSEVAWHYLRRGLRLGTIGAAVGTVAALLLTRLLGSVLYGVSATDPLSFASALGVVLGGVIVASIVPAWRAARTSPLTALRQ